MRRSSAVRSFIGKVLLGSVAFWGCSAEDSSETTPVVISEIMYHPAGETGSEDVHEFVELSNTGAAAANVAGFRLRIGAKERLTLPEGTILEPGGHLVLAKRRATLLAVSQYGLQPAAVIGDYAGELDNGGGEVALLDRHGRVVDAVRYDDAAPWPVGADAFGVQEEWLPALAPFAAHAGLGRSLERIDLTKSGNSPANWEASAVDGATPGRVNGVASRAQPIALAISASAERAPAALIRASDAVRVSVTLSDGSLPAMNLEYRLDPVEKIGTSVRSLPMTKVPGTATEYAAVVPPTAENTIVRYRVVTAPADGEEAVQISPRTTDPREFHAYFVNPAPPTGRAYHLFIAPERWTALWRNIEKPLSEGCTVNAAWDATVPAVFVHDGAVYDVQVRYQGSRFQRRNGFELPRWTAPGPAAPAPLQVLSWRVKFPRYAQFDGQRTINLNKLRQACPGVLNALEGRLFAKAGIPAQEFRFARVYVNGGYYNYAMEVHGVDEETVADLEGNGNPVGDLFKADGDLGDGPWGRSNFSPLGSSCSLSSQRRYELTYERLTHDGAGPSGHAALIGLIQGLDSVRASADADPEVRDYFAAHFDVPKLITKFALRNFAGAWDDGFHNFYLYQRPRDGKWEVFPQDFDCDFGAASPNCGRDGAPYNGPTVSFFHPETPGGYTAGGAPELQLKIQLIKAYRKEFAARVAELEKTLFSEASITGELAKVMEGFDRTAWNEAPARYCDLDARLAEAETWLRNRRAFAAAGVR